MSYLPNFRDFLNFSLIYRQRSQSAKNLQERVQSALPDSMKTQVLVKSRIEDPEICAQRKLLTQSKSVSELSQVTSLSDFPIPTTIEKMMSKSRTDVSKTSQPLSIDW
jgi:hypothetical protein